MNVDIDVVLLKHNFITLHLYDKIYFKYTVCFILSSRLYVSIFRHFEAMFRKEMKSDNLFCYLSVSAFTRR
jgi:hypothetical protein